MHANSHVAADAGGLNAGRYADGARSGGPLPLQAPVSTAAAPRPTAVGSVTGVSPEAATAAARPATVAAGSTTAQAHGSGGGGAIQAGAAGAPRGAGKPGDAAVGGGGGTGEEESAGAGGTGVGPAGASDAGNALTAAEAATGQSGGGTAAEAHAGGARMAAGATASANRTLGEGVAKALMPCDGTPAVKDTAEAKDVAEAMIDAPAEARAVGEDGPAGEDRPSGADGEGSANRARTSGKSEGWRPPDDASWVIEEPEAGTETARRCPTRDLWRQFQEALDKGLRPLALREELRGILKAGRQILADQPRVGRMCRGKEEPTVARAKALLSQLTERMKACHKRRTTETVDTEEVPGQGGSQGGSPGGSGRTRKRSASDVRGSTADRGGSEERCGAAGDDEAACVGTRSRAGKRRTVSSGAPAERPRRSGGSAATERGKRARK